MTDTHEDSDDLAQQAAAVRASAEVEAKSREAAQRAFDMIKASREQRALNAPLTP